MTLLHKTIRRELPQTFDRRSWIVELESWGVQFRAKRTRRSYPIAWSAIWDKAMKIAVEQERKERIERRKLARKAV
jgi:hypothetical protein